jgi:hypothetical protein
MLLPSIVTQANSVYDEGGLSSQKVTVFWPEPPITSHSLILRRNTKILCSGQEIKTRKETAGTDVTLVLPNCEPSLWSSGQSSWLQNPEVPGSIPDAARFSE